MKFFNLFIAKKRQEVTSSEFSRFFREASSSEKEKVFMDIARKASEDQQKVIESVRSA